MEGKQMGLVRRTTESLERLRQERLLNALQFRSGPRGASNHPSEPPPGVVSVPGANGPGMNDSLSPPAAPPGIPSALLDSSGDQETVPEHLRPVEPRVRSGLFHFKKRTGCLRRKESQPIFQGHPLAKLDTWHCEFCQCKLDSEGFAFMDAVRCPTCQRDQWVPGRMDHFLLREEIGRGAMGRVYRAFDETLHRQVALKVLRESLLKDAQMVQRILAEARLAATLQHPHIVHIHMVGNTGGTPYIVMELLQTSRLNVMIHEEGALDPLFVMRTGYDVIQALQAAGRIGLVHGDIKPANILFDAYLNAKLIDFGLASFAQSPVGELWGTPLYIAPEKITEKRMDARSDQYSLGATLWHALAGRPPFDGDDVQAVLRSVLHQPVPDLRQHRPDLPERIPLILTRMMERDPERRFHDLAALRMEFLTVLRELRPQGFHPDLELTSHDA